MSFLPQTHTHIRLIGDYKIAEDVQYKINQCMDDWLNVTCGLKHFKWSVRLKRYLNVCRQVAGRLVSRLTHLQEAACHKDRLMNSLHMT